MLAGCPFLAVSQMPVIATIAPKEQIVLLGLVGAMCQSSRQLRGNHSPGAQLHGLLSAGQTLPSHWEPQFFQPSPGEERAGDMGHTNPSLLVQPRGPPASQIHTFQPSLEAPIQETQAGHSDEIVMPLGSGTTQRVHYTYHPKQLYLK